MSFVRYLVSQATIVLYHTFHAVRCLLEHWQKYAHARVSALFTVYFLDSFGPWLLYHYDDGLGNYPLTENAGCWRQYLARSQICPGRNEWSK